MECASSQIQSRGEHPREQRTPAKQKALQRGLREKGSNAFMSRSLLTREPCSKRTHRVSLCRLHATHAHSLNSTVSAIHRSLRRLALSSKHSRCQLSPQMRIACTKRSQRVCFVIHRRRAQPRLFDANTCRLWIRKYGITETRRESGQSSNTNLSRHKQSISGMFRFEKGNIECARASGGQCP